MDEILPLAAWESRMETDIPSQNSMVKRLQVKLCLLQQDYAGAERIVEDLAQAVDDMRAEIANHRERYAALESQR